jgi:uncharacterized membrane-anchored protein YitT (DUF2179 family)
VALDYAVIALGAVLIALAADMFLIPNQVVSGGVVGVSTILYYLIGTPVGLVTLFINIPLFIAGVLWAGGITAGIRTVFGVVVMSLAIDFLQPYVPHVTADPLLYTLYGGLLDGLGLGLVLRAGGTTGGTDILAKLFHRLWGVRLGVTLLAANVVILGAAAFIFGVEPALYALLITYVSSQVVDLVQEGLTHSRSCLIISTQHALIRQAILVQMERGVTVLHGEGGYTGQERPVLLCAIAQHEVSRLKRLVQEIDPAAFVIVSPASEVLGEGFKGLVGR